MFEFDKHVPSADFAAASPREAYAPLAGIRRRSFLLWGEHCIECAAPDCFASCDLYDARPDRRCRRFESGVYRNRAFAGASGYGAEIRFKTWGKLEARGHALLLPPALVRALEAGLGLALPVADRVGRLADRLFGDIRWSYLGYSLLERIVPWLRRRGARTPPPDMFAIELYNPEPEPASLLFSMSVDRTKLPPGSGADRVPPPLQLDLAIPPGYFRRLVPAELFADLLASGLPYNVAFTPAGEGLVRLVFLTADFVRLAPGAAGALPAGGAETRPGAKCVVFDLDNTLWRGILVEGPVRLRAGVADLFRSLDERGILISAVSRNDPAEAMAQLEAFGLADYILHPAIGWGAKSEGLRRIADELGLGLDSFMLVDDSPFERDEVARALPEVELLDERALDDLVDHPRLAGTVTRESRARRLMYREAGEREAAALTFGDDYLEFLRSCAIEVAVRPERPDDRERVQELVQRTNQLNFSGRKYDRLELERLLGEPGLDRHVVSCRDRYGDYGIVGFCLSRRLPSGLLIEDLMLSCRVQGKYVEQALLSHLCARGRPRVVKIRFRPTGRNAAAAAVLGTLGFAAADADLLARDVPTDRFATDLVAVNRPRRSATRRADARRASRAPGKAASRPPSG
ncbi:MAG: HAD-IIIC family phosphatase [Sphingomonas sp.]|nr:HAD-IIIC family phosphatase [Sphingomonas sp.]